jgi:hypothetical protein
MGDIGDPGDADGQNGGGSVPGVGPSFAAGSE